MSKYNFLKLSLAVCLNIALLANTYGYHPSSAASKLIHYSEASEEIDLYISSLTPSSNYFRTGDTEYIQITVENLGSASAPSSFLHFYLSSDMTIDDNDLKISSASCNSINASQKRDVHHYITVQQYDEIESGIYYLIVIADANDAITESNEENNIFITQVIYIESNLTPIEENFTLHNISLKNDSLVNEDIRNVYFTLSSKTSKYRLEMNLYLSSDKFFSKTEDHLLLGQEEIGPITEGTADYYAPYQFTLPDTETSRPLKYYLFAEIDPNNKYDESNEDDNVMLDSALFISSGYNDISIDSCFIDYDSVLLGQTFSVESYIANNGLLFLEDISLGYYLSEDPIYDDADLLLDEDNIDYLFSGETSTEQESFSLNSVSEGIYYIICVADNNSVIENDIRTSNNMAALPIKIIDPNSINTLDIELLSTVEDSLCVGYPDTISFQYKFTNKEERSLSFGCFLSSDSVFDDHDFNFQIASLTSSASPNQCSTKDIYFEIPDTLSKDEYYLIIKADDSNDIFEEDETNNTIITPIVIKHLAPSITLYTYKNNLPQFNIQAGSLYSGSIFCNNTSNINTDSILLKAYFARQNESYDPDNAIWIDTLVNLQDKYNEIPVSVPIPNDITPELYNITFFYEPLSPDPDVVYSLYASTKSIAVNDKTIDYELSDLSISPLEYTQKTQVELNYSISTHGTATSNSPTLTSFLSKDNILSKDDILLSESLLNGFGINQEININTSFQLPANLNPDDYFILTIIDEANFIPESNEINNQISTPIHVTSSSANLLISAFEAESNSVTQNNSLNNTLTVLNDGTEATSYYKLAQYVSQDTIIDSEDLRIYWQLSDPLDANETFSRTVSFTPSTSLDTGKYYIISKVDIENNLAETEENDNIEYIEIHVTAGDFDLEIMELPGRDTLKLCPGDAANYNVSLRNNGNDPISEECYIEAYISSDTILSKVNDTKISYNSLNSINALETIEFSFYTFVSSGIPEGKYYLHLIIDSDNKFIESNEGNNNFIIPLELIFDKDLSIKDFTVNTEIIKSGGPINYSYTVVNSGSVRTNTKVKSSLYVSNDTILSGDDTYVEYDDIARINEKSELQITNTQQVPYSLETGSYYLLNIIDSFQQMNEINEDNNCVAIPIVIHNQSAGADYCFISSAQARENNTIQISFSVFNNGSTNIYSNAKAVIYQSQDMILDEYDNILEQMTIPPLNIGESHKLEYNYPQPSYTQEYLIIVLDGTNVLVETNEQNNTQSFLIPALPFDLQIVSSLVKDTLSTSDTILVESIIEYIGNKSISTAKLEYYISENETINNSSLLLQEVSTELNTNNPTAYSFSSPIPEGLCEGQQFLIVSLNSDSLSLESDTNNNLQIFQFTYLSTDITNNTNKDKISIYPIPSDQYIFVKTDHRYKQYSVFSINGSCLRKGSITGSSTEIQTSNLSNGIYILMLKSETQNKNIKFEVMH